MLLEDEQYQLLAKFVEAHRNTTRENRGGFIAIQAYGESQAIFLHLMVGNLEFEGSLSDAEVLAHEGLLHMSYGSKGDKLFTVLPQGIKVYEQKKVSSPAIKELLAEPKEFISTHEFKKVHGTASAKWEQAARLLWNADSMEQLTTIGHLCREALQEFTTSLAHEKKVDLSSIEPAKTVSRLKYIIDISSSIPSAKTKTFLSTLISYWGVVSDLVQRQEHGAQKEGEDLVWEDARRVVFHTCVVMFELSKNIKQ